METSAEIRWCFFDTPRRRRRRPRCHRRRRRPNQTTAHCAVRGIGRTGTQHTANGQWCFWKLNSIILAAECNNIRIPHINIYNNRQYNTTTGAFWRTYTQHGYSGHTGSPLCSLALSHSILYVCSTFTLLFRTCLFYVRPENGGESEYVVSVSVMPFDICSTETV